MGPPGTLNGCIASVLKDLLHLRPKVLVCLPSLSCLPDIMVDLNELSSLDVFVLSRRQEGTKMYEIFFLEHQARELARELFCCLTQHKALKSMSMLIDLSIYYHIHCMGADSCAHRIQPGLLKFSFHSFKQKFVAIMS